MTARAAKKPSTADDVFCRVTDDGKLAPADDASKAMLREKGLRRGELVRMKVVRIRDEREYEQWKKAHQLGKLIARNIEEFERFQMENGNVRAHAALKHLQFLSNIECDETMVTLADGTEIIARQARTLAFDKMGHEQFTAAYKGFCDYLRKRWWGDELDERQIEEMGRMTE